MKVGNENVLIYVVFLVNYQEMEGIDDEDDDDYIDEEDEDDDDELGDDGEMIEVGDTTFYDSKYIVFLVYDSKYIILFLSVF